MNDDTISRRAAIDAVMRDDCILDAMDSVDDGEMHKTKRAITRILASLPSVQPDIARNIATIIENEQDMRVILNAPSAQQRWIPVGEQETPDEDLCTGNGVQYSKDVLMTVYNKYDDKTIIDYGHTVDGEWYSWTTDCHIPPWWKVIAWMPLPEPWRGGQDGTT